MQTPRNGLLGKWMLFGVADGVGDLILLKGQRVRQDHLDGRAYVQKEMVRAEEQPERGSHADGSADRGADDGTFTGATGTGHA